MMRFQKSTMLLPSLRSEVRKREFFSSSFLEFLSIQCLLHAFFFFFNLLFIESFLSLGSYSSLLYNLTAFFILGFFNRKCLRLDVLNNIYLFIVILESGQYKIKVLADFVSCESLVPLSQVAIISWCSKLVEESREVSGSLL